MLHTGDLKIANEQHNSASKFKVEKVQRCTALSHLSGA